MAGIVLLPFSLRALRYFQKRDLLIVAAVGVIGNMIPAYLFATAQQYVPSALAGMLNSLVPLFTVALGMLFFNIKTIRRQWMGVVIGLIGAGALILGGERSISETPVIPSLMIILATACYATSVNLIYKYLSKRSSINVAAIALLLASPLPLLHLLFTGFWQKAISSQENLINLGYISILAIVGTALAVVIFNYLIQKSSAVFSSSVTYLIPVVAIGWGLLDGETVTSIQLFSVGGIFFAIRMINSG